MHLNRHPAYVHTQLHNCKKNSKPPHKQLAATPKHLSADAPELGNLPPLCAAAGSHSPWQYSMRWRHLCNDFGESTSEGVQSLIRLPPVAAAGAFSSAQTCRKVRSLQRQALASAGVPHSHSSGPPGPPQGLIHSSSSSHLACCAHPGCQSCCCCCPCCWLAVVPHTSCMMCATQS